VLLTGAGGFIGGNTARTLREAGHEVVAYHRASAGIPVSVPDGADIVVNCAGKLGGQGHSKEDLREANFLLPTALADHCRKLNIPLIHLSTPGVCGLRANGKETDSFQPEGDYETIKAEADTYLLHNLPGVTILRPDFVFGPGDMHKLPLFRQVSKGWFPLVGAGLSRTRPTDVRDVARAVTESFPGGTLHGGVYNIAGPEIISVRQIAATIGSALNVKPVLVPVPRFVFRILLMLGPLCPSSLSKSRYRLFGTHRYTNTDKAQRAGFRPGHFFSDTALSAAEWYRERGLL